VSRDPERPLVWGIETSCDDTACALVDGGGRVVASVVSSQLAAHAPYGGVVPEIASREHLANWPAVAAETCARAGVGLDQVDVVAATRGPGLVGSLLVGLSLGRAFAWARRLPFHGVHHLEGHVFSPFLAVDGGVAAPIPERFVALVVSGGHTSLYAVDGARIETLAETRDDAFGEAFDKLGKRLGLAYPQGPKVDLLAEAGVASRSPLPRLAGTEELFFSYSGLKTQAIVALEKLEAQGLAAPTLDGEGQPTFAQPVLDLVAGFRDSAVRQVLDRLTRLHRRSPFELLAVAGGAAANRELRRRLPDWAAERGVDLRLVPLVYSGDNAAMIAFAALRRERSGSSDDPLEVEAASRVPIAG
jgi:N6-L-threonylcarbamoyladenine synthase